MDMLRLPSFLTIDEVQTTNDEFLLSVSNTAWYAHACQVCKAEYPTVHHELCWDCMIEIFGDPYDV